MASPRDEFAAYCVELLGSAGGARSRRMFGGHGLYIDDLFVAIVVGERLYLKADDESRARFEEAGCQPFIYDAKGKPMTMSYYSVPDEAMESRELMQPWGGRGGGGRGGGRPPPAPRTIRGAGGTARAPVKIRRPAAAARASAARPAKRAAR